jgi:hypothetical protein
MCIQKWSPQQILVPVGDILEGLKMTNFAGQKMLTQKKDTDWISLDIGWFRDGHFFRKTSVLLIPSSAVTGLQQRL